MCGRHHVPTLGAVPACVHTVLSGVFGGCTLVTDIPFCVAFAFGYCFAVLKSTVD